jgi:hypothetical protein
MNKERRGSSGMTYMKPRSKPHVLDKIRTGKFAEGAIRSSVPKTTNCFDFGSSKEIESSEILVMRKLPTGVAMRFCSKSTTAAPGSTVPSFCFISYVCMTPLQLRSIASAGAIVIASVIDMRSPVTVCIRSIPLSPPGTLHGFQPVRQLLKSEPDSANGDQGFSSAPCAVTGTLVAPRMVVVTLRCRQSHGAMKAPTQIPSCADRAIASSAS